MHIPDGVVWLASYPKSGNTWMRLLLANVQNRDGLPVGINHLDMGTVVYSRWLFDASTLADSSLLRPDESEPLRTSVIEEFVREQDAPLFAKVHDAWTVDAAGTPMLGRRARAALYLVRDPRDVVVSFAYHNEDRLDATIKLLNNAAAYLSGTARVFPQRLGDWSGHVNGWRHQTEIPVSVIRYEDLQRDTSQVLRRTLEWLGSDSNADMADSVSRAVRHCELSELQRQERESGFRLRPESTLSPGASLFFRRGRVGDWRDHLSPAQVREIERTHGETMVELGYALESE